MAERHFDARALGFHELLEEFARSARCETTKQKILSLVPYGYVSSLQDDFETLSEYITLAHKGFTFASEELVDMEEMFRKLALEGAILSPEETLLFRRLLTLLENNIQLFQEVQRNQEVYPHLYSLCATLEDYPEMRRTIDGILSPEGEIFENASPHLIEIREKKRNLRKNIQQKLETFIADETVQGYLQDTFVTVKEGRFVLPIKTSMKNVFQREYQAILHSYSKTGETVYMEPAFIIDANNEILEIDELELQEMWRLMGEITGLLRQIQVGLKIVYEVCPIWEWLHLRFLYWKSVQGTLPQVSETPHIHIREARHPFLREKAVPVDILLEGYQSLIISGPNAGGKTVSLKTAGLLVLMGMCGIPLPATEARLGVFHKVYAEIGDEQNLERALSSFTAQIVSLQTIWENADSTTLVLIDEIANNTDPREGEALAKAYLQALLAKGAMVIITTHYNGLKQMAYEDRRIQNASVMFDSERLLPLYKLQYGESSMSFALDIARRHGLEKSIINAASRYLEEMLSPTEKLLQEVEKQKQLLVAKQQKLEKRMAEVFQMELSYQKKLKELEVREKTLKEKQLEKMSEELSTLREEINRLHEMVKKSQLSPKDLEKQADIIEKRIQQSQKSFYQPIRVPQVGQTVFLPSFQASGVIESIQRDKAKVRVGGISFIVSLEEIYTSEQDVPSSPQPSPRETFSFSQHMKTSNLSLDVRGKTVDEALREVEKTLDKALLEGAAVVYIIHGMGGGILQRAIHDFLRQQKNVASYEFAPQNEGGRGKTIVRIR
ncbi:endonuclease MutS2 [Thermospira aquatica]|uniref:Endonuclease MutS2 n=1 Tax=Thermospira aquatica TaxID=2828656 RepID=A0AAX3BC12_9SPIR|nr:Smr/MutS family protein [Thermospira aquatica]URA09853.1 Smr/MutS family protein [Thermospira aquatica]